jgi:hypothetical protein
MEQIIQKLKETNLPINYRKTNRKYVKKFIDTNGGNIYDIIYSLPIYLKDVEEPIVIKEDKILLDYYLNVVKNGQKQKNNKKCNQKVKEFSQCLFKNKKKLSFVPISINEQIIKKNCGGLNRCINNSGF